MIIEVWLRWSYDPSEGDALVFIEIPEELSFDDAVLALVEKRGLYGERIIVAAPVKQGQPNKYKRLGLAWVNADSIAMIQPADPSIEAEGETT